MRILRSFWKTQYQEMLRNYHRMMYGYNCVVRMRAITSPKGEELGWVLVVTNIPLSEHTKHFLRERGLPVPGKFKCTMDICQRSRDAVLLKRVS
jgi:hypothetical protein